MNIDSERAKLSHGFPVDASQIVSDDLLSLATAITGEMTATLDTVNLDELVSFPEVSGGTPKPSVEGTDPHLSMPHGWDPFSRTGLRFPNPPYPRRLSPVIAFQTSQQIISPDVDSRLARLQELGSVIGEQVLAEAKLLPILQPYADAMVTYETRVNANLAGPLSPLWPTVVPKGYLHAPHQDRSVATVGLGATADGFNYYDFDTGEYAEGLPKHYAFLGKSNGHEDRACLHSVVSPDTESGNSILPLTAFKVGRVSLVVFLQGQDFLDRLKTAV